MKAALLWAAGIAASLGAHAALFAFLALATEPDPLEAEPQASGRIKMTSYEVPQSKAAPQETKGEAQNAETAAGQNLGQGPVRTETAEAQPLAQPPQQAVDPAGARTAAQLPDNTAIAEIRNEVVVEASTASGAPIPALRAEGELAKADPLTSEPIAPQAPPPATAASQPSAPPATTIATTQPPQTAVENAATPLAPHAPEALSLASNPPPATTAEAATLPKIVLASASAPTQALGPTAPNAGPVPASSLVAEASSQISPDAPVAEAKAPPAAAAPRRAPDAPAASQPPLDAPSASQPPLNAPVVTAATGWSGAATTFDPASLAAVQSFMRPLDTPSDDSARDGIAQILSAAPCSRVAATFIPETGTLELRGHIPDDSLREPLLNAIRRQLGESIPVGGSMLVLPSPQCDVLSQLETLGLPQSQGQHKDPMQIGAITQINTFDYGVGERVIVEMRSPDYPAYVYVDFFDVDDRVLHLRPNQWENVELHSPDTPLEIGADRDGQTSVKLIVSPPYGQELAIAYATSIPLYDGLRETIEPAESYLDYLRTRIAELKAENPDYKGEWVYMFIQTHQ